MEQFIDESLLIRYLTETVTGEEKEMVEQWRSMSPENEKTVEQYYFALQAGDRLRVMKSVNPDRSLKALKRQISEKEKEMSRQRFIRRFQQVAAVLLFPLIAFSVWMMLNPKETPFLQYVEIRSNPGMVSLVNLPDRSKVWLNGGTWLKYPVNFDAEKRTVEMSGQGYFEVDHRPTHPFIVETAGNFSVEVVGTSFNLTAYEDEKIIETTLVDGSVKLHLEQGGKIVQKMMQPGEKVVYAKDSQILRSEMVNSEYEIAWKDNRIMFRGHSMEQVMRSLGRYYNVRFVVKDDLIMNSEITGKFHNEQLPQVMEYLKIASGIKYRIIPGIVENDRLTPSVVEIWK